MSSRHKATPRKPKAAKEAEKQARQLPTSTIIKKVGRATALLILAGIASPVSQLSLSPVYGSIPASLHHQRSVTFTALGALIGRTMVKKYLPSNLAGYIAVIAYWIPVIQYFLFQFSGQLGIDYGPLVIESATYLPFLLLSVYAASELLETLDLSQFNLSPTITDMVPPLASYITISSVSKFTAAILPDYVGTHLSFTRVGLQMLIGSLSALLTPSRVILFAAPALLHTMLANPHYASDAGFQKTNATLFSTQNFTLLARQESITGYVSVLESHNDVAFRLLRCDHSLLGGEWLVTPTSAANGQTKRETIFSVFVLLEAVRLVKPVTPDAVSLPDSQKAALVIGLGIGTAPNALISHNINTTIVELDPVVHHYATKFFNLSPNHTAVIDDAVAYVHHKSRSSPGSFNYIIHDVFTGGAEPVDLFTREFFQGLSNLLTDDGVVAINYAGDLSLPSTRLVLNTIHAVFPACRLFRDSPQSETWAPGDPDFINMVVFCVKNDGGRGKKAIAFREPVLEDFSGSIARQNFLAPKEELEIMFEYKTVEQGGSVMGKSDVGELEEWHKLGAVSHWRIMRTVLPDQVWELW
ncbi:S-adenosyl-L-methionine-dependent methyltransferase [Clohesyomyces aquaticus]|uniref:S-adenosyl-L-methionine-dependent methyltransferase n=1 Tax=Clohesyomyces aquaticus TaxID=1231657 RepID=A0A1Y2A6W0_9PLEO|nr:S-adenosyl-L-methionine-dependent methyltransferase [Clohesyomyces aquaticus]